ncbi:hypothetical protein QVD17_35398 [Tagetes erecta]|uniref:Mitochondrial import inner membrane translocase subunit Tim17/Tim22/Tim23 family protein n=1 Tax=Tagetes erecta TaxID=13708 RepID=A0AAD8K3I2_TARER|nr:hypothetical protein QVD17_35398 [Tagetes erecta]
MAPNSSCYCPPRAADTALKMDNKKKQELEFSAEDSLLGPFENWVSKQHVFVEATYDAVIGAVFGALNGLFIDFVFNHVLGAKGVKLPKLMVARLGAYGPLLQSMITSTRLGHVRNLAVIYGVNSGVSCVMKKLTHNDAHSRMVAGFSAGVTLSLVNGMRGKEVVSIGIMLALVGGLLHKEQEEYSEPKAKDVLQDSVDNHQKMNFNTCWFTRNALSPLNDRQVLTNGITVLVMMGRRGRNEDVADE